MSTLVQHQAQHRLAPLLRPRSIAMVGASNQAGRIGGMPLDLLRHFGYAGRVYPINPKYQEVFGYTCYPDVESLPDVPDLVVLAIGADDVTPMLQRCHAKGIPAAIVYAAGFAEAGERGTELQRALEVFVQESGMVVAGPNCMGFANLNLQAHTAFASVFRNVPIQIKPGRVSVLTQSGNVCSAVFALIRRLDVPVSHFINTGNEATLEFSEYLSFLAQDNETDCVVGYVEQLRHGPRFIEAALSLAAQNKPLILYKAGETEKGSEAVRSHTSALAGNLALYQASFEQLNVIRGTDFAQMADLAYLSGFRHREGGSRVAIVTMSGALGAILADKLILAGLDVPTLPQEVQQVMRDGIPDYGMVSNPIDVTGNVVNQPEFVRTIFAALAETDAVDTVIVYAPGYLLDRMADPLIDICTRYSRLFVAIDTGAAQCRARLAEAGIPVFDDLGRATQSIAPYCHWMARRSSVSRWARLRETPMRRHADGLLPSKLNEFDTKALLGRYGVPVGSPLACSNADDAVVAADTLGWPVALKILSADIAHKTEAGGVKLNLADAEALRLAFDDVLQAAAEYEPTARIDGVLVEPMARRGIVELIAGVTRDPVFGQALTVGLGGELTELYRDASHRLLPIDASMVEEMLRSLKAWPLLDGFRGRPSADVKAACESIAALCTAASSFGDQVDALEINPLLIRAHGEGAVALDALLLTRTSV
ncbi:acetate--CoA ligase family protein [Alcaligenaceae bacterium B3P038]|nr:acetate--CoA ligase family protein [Alcaligenaceae bacterium B3P038]